MATSAHVKRARATPTAGARTTLRVPPDLAEAADRLAAQEGVSRNAALILLAQRGAETVAADAEAERVREQIRKIVTGPLDETGSDEYLSQAEVAAAILEARGGRP